MSNGNKELRNYGIDSLRLLSVFYVVILHTLGAGGILDTVSIGSGSFYAGWFAEAWTFCAVNIFALISGYVGYTDVPNKKSIANYIQLWIEVVFYNVIITIFVQVTHPELADSRVLIASFFPVTTKLYWYFSSYTALFLVTPLLNAGIRSCSKGVLRKLLVLIFLLFSVYESLSHSIWTNSGYSFVWLMVLYIVGAILKKCNIGKNITLRKGFFMLLVLSVVTLAWKLYGWDGMVLGIPYSRDLFLSYISPTVFLSAIIHVLCAANIRFPPAIEKIIAFLSPGAFSVYILNCQKYIWELVMTNHFVSLSTRHFLIMLFYVLAFAFGFTLVALLIDRVRNALFHLLRIQSFAQKCDQFFQNALEWLVKLVEVK